MTMVSSRQLADSGQLVGYLDVGPLGASEENAACCIPIHADDEYGDCPAYMTPDVARAVAAQLIALADEADRRVSDGEFGVLKAVATLEEWTR